MLTNQLTPNIMAKLYKADGTMISVQPNYQEAEFGYQQLQELVGGYFEFVMLAGGKVMVVNENGRLNGLPKNIEASFFANRTIVGDVVLCSPKEAGLKS